MVMNRPTPSNQDECVRADRAGLALSGALLLIGFATLQVSSAFHPGGVPNDHVSSFTLYAASSGWTADHLATFAAFAFTISGLLVLLYALRLSSGLSALVARIGSGLAAVAIALSAVRFAVDGVVLKRAVDAWVSAPEAERAARFASAETVRWMEEAAMSYQTIVIGLTLIVLAGLIVGTARVPRPIGLLLALSGAGYLVTGWILGASGFAPEGATPNAIGQFVPVLAALYLLIVAWRMPSSAATVIPDVTARRDEQYA